MKTELPSTPFSGMDHPAEGAMLRASQIKVDDQYQRQLNMSHVRAIAGAFDMLAFGVVLVSERADGSYWVIDGQHRLEAVRMRGGDDLIPCHIYRGLTIMDEATVFHMQTNRRSISPIDRFRARLFAHEPQAMAIEAILRRHSLQVGNVEHKDVRAIGRVERIYVSHGAERLDLLLDLIMRATRDDQIQAPTDVLLEGVNAFLARYDEAINRARLVDCIRQLGVVRIKRQAESMRDLARMPVGSACGRVLLGAYNSRLTANRLPEWDDFTSGRLGQKSRKGRKDATAAQSMGTQS